MRGSSGIDAPSPVGGPRTVMEGGSVNPEQRLAELRRRREESLAGGGPERIAKLHAKGCLPARERPEILLDAGPFVEVGPFATHGSPDFGMARKRITGAAVAAGWGAVDGRLASCFAQDS